MAQAGTFTGVIQQALNTAVTNASIADVTVKLKEVDKANDALKQRWAELMSSPEASSYRANKKVADADQTKLIVGLENLLGKLTLVCLAQQSVLSSVVGALNNLNKKTF